MGRCAEGVREAAVGLGGDPPAVRVGTDVDLPLIPAEGVAEQATDDASAKLLPPTIGRAEAGVGRPSVEVIHDARGLGDGVGALDLCGFLSGVFGRHPW